MEQELNGYQIKILKLYRKWERIIHILPGNTYDLRMFAADLVKEFPFLKEFKDDPHK